MSVRRVLSARRAPVALSLLAFALTTCALAWETTSKPEEAATKRSRVFVKPEPAKNPTTLQLQADEAKVVGWVSGPRDYSGRPVYVSRGVEKIATLKVGRDNTFTWPYKVDKPTTVELLVDDCYKESVFPRASVTLTPPPAAPGPCVFFVVDRTAYRPGQALHFAGFLRKQPSPGEFAPAASQAVEVELVSQRKATKAAKIKLTSDEQGRVAGSYAFTDADALDTYTLSIPGYKGQARVLLGEYRKSKVKLKITGAVEGEKMKLTFEGLDFLDKPVAVTKASFNAQVVRRGKQKALALKADDFVYHDPHKYPFGDLDSLSEEDLLYWEAEGQGSQGAGSVPLSNLSGELKPEGTKPTHHTIDLQKDWLKGDCAVVVQGVITDANGREQRASATVTIDEKGGAKKGLELALAKRRYFTGEPIEVRAEGETKPTSLVVMKLAFQTPSAAIQGLGTFFNPYYQGRYPYYRSARYRPVDLGALTGQETIRRSLVTAVGFKDDQATLTLKEPGAYKLIAVAPRDGETVQKEVTVVVRRLDDINTLLLRLDKEEFASGDRLTGVVHGRYTDAKALLTVRDSTGIRLTKTVTFAGGMCELNEVLPADLRYGCTIDVCYPDEAGQAHIAQGFFRVVPNDRTLTVDVKAPATVTPGASVDLELQVNRKESVDLVVSVYDQALLGIAADRSANIRDFFLADERAAGRIDKALVARRLGDVRLGALVKKTKELLKEADKAEGKKMPPHERSSLESLLSRYSSRHLYPLDAATLARLAGVEVFLSPIQYTNWHRAVAADGSDRLIDLLTFDYNGWTLAPRFVGNTLLLHEAHQSHLAQGYAWHPIYGWNYGYGGYGGRYNLNLLGGPNYYGFNQLGGQYEFFSRGMARGDSARSWNGPSDASGNSMHSFAPEAQGFISHLPAPGAAVLLDADGDQSHISVRRDFSDSAYWNANVRTDEQGKAKVTFKVPDSLTNWQVVVTAVSRKMHVGSAKASFRTYKPIMVWPMLPRTFTEGDRVEVFASVHNRTDEPRRIRVRLKVENGSIDTPEEKTIDVKAKENAPVYWTFRPGQAGYTQLLMSADCEAGSDASLKRLPVLRAAAEQVVTASGTVRKTATIEVPEGVDPKSARLEISFAPSLAADMADTLNYLVEYPYGCVEQTMSRFLPAIKVAQILRQFKVDHPQLEKKLPGCVAGGIKRLLELQQPDGGWAWHGGGQTHEMMTPYALYGLLQAEKAGYQIPNESAVTRGLSRLEHFVNSMGDAQVSDRVYCMYVFSHRRDLTAAHWQWLAGHASKGTLSDYALALVVEMAVEKKQAKAAAVFAKALRKRAKESGGRAWWETAGFSRWGEDKFEVTAAALKALVAHDKDDPLIDGMLGFFVATKRGDRWNSTKDTAMILFAMADYLAKTEYSPQAKKTLTVSVNGGDAQEVRFDDQLTKKVVVPGDRLKVGANTLTFGTAMTGVLYRAVFRYWKAGRDVAPMDSGIQVARTFHLLDGKGNEVRHLKSGDRVPRGSYVMSVVTATNRLPANMSYVLVESPKASGGETVPADDARFAGQHSRTTAHALREDREAMTVYHHEQTPQTLSDRSVFLAELAGEFVVPPASVEMMYQTETRGHSGTFVLTVTE